MKIRCPHCQRPAAIRIEGGSGELRQTIQCGGHWGCGKVYRAVIRLNGDACRVQTAALHGATA